MELLDREATRFAESLDDYDHVSVTDIGGWGPLSGIRLVLRRTRATTAWVRAPFVG